MATLARATVWVLNHFDYDEPSRHYKTEVWLIEPTDEDLIESWHRQWNRREHDEGQVMVDRESLSWQVRVTSKDKFSSRVITVDQQVAVTDPSNIPLED